MANMSLSMEYAIVCRQNELFRRGDIRSDKANCSSICCAQDMAFLGGGLETRTVARWTCRVSGSWGGCDCDSAGHVQVVLAAEVLVEKAEILKIIKRRQVMYVGLEQELLMK